MPDNSSMDGGLPRPKKIGRRSKLISKYKRRALKHVWVVRVGIMLVALALIYLLVSAVGNLLESTGVTGYTDLASAFLLTPEDNIESFEGRTNLVVLGRSGEGQDSPDLTDTIIFASISHSDKSVTLISIPRDIWIPELRAKLNSVYYWGNQKQEGGGLVLMKSTVEEIVGQPVHYGVVIDFDGFVRIVDELGGVEVNVKNAFVDNRYPIDGKEDDECDGDLEFTCRYETIEFGSGSQVMGGETALKFVRSRNAEGDEGTDIARAARQQKVLDGLKARVISRDLILSPKKEIEVFKIIDGSIETDLDPVNKSVLARRMIQARNNINSDVLSEDLLINPPISYLYDNLYVFIPKSESVSEDSEDSWNEVHEWVESVLSQ